MSCAHAALCQRKVIVIWINHMVDLYLLFLLASKLIY